MGFVRGLRRKARCEALRLINSYVGRNFLSETCDARALPLVGGMLPVKTSGHVTTRNREFLQLPLPRESIVAGP